ncbi:MAG TPA: glycosyltransferase family 39 protein, partial [Thermoanaerobaculia bacterium]|nr:glycosyltransferase family 39 protein [Thermoanaerobaculia bacterium]
AFVLAVWGIGRLALSLGGDRRVALLAATIFCLVPAFQANAQIATQDGLLVAFWVALTAAGLRLFRRWRRGQGTFAEWALVWALLGAGTLLKQSVLLFLPCLAAQVVVERRARKRGLGRFLSASLPGAGLFLAITSPIWLWNARHGWPMLVHTLGHLGLGGDQAAVSRGNPALGLVSFLGGLVGALGPLFGLLVLRGRAVSDADDFRRLDRAWLLSASVPVVAFIALLSLTKPVIATWVFPMTAPLAILAAEAVETGRDRTTRWLWGGFVAYGLVAQIVLFFPQALAKVPFWGEKLQPVMRRFTGRHDEARRVARALATLEARRVDPLLIAPHYMDASLLTFYLPDHPTVFCAGTWLGRRPTTFDLWPDTNLTNPALFGRSLLLVGGVESAWRDALDIGGLEPTGDGFLLATNYRGPRHAAPANP